MIAGVLVPLFALGALAWLLPRLAARWLPRSMRGLVMNGAICGAILFAAGVALFAALYGDAAGVVWSEAPAHFAVLSARAALLWGPVLVLSLAGLPRRWGPGAWAEPGAEDRDMRGGD
ncbi:hypothetical protein [Jannaschia sp. W003]|uniref:hypothetical protein n=1 Tax=Jannaschia sp. W003 TaxID=2867012 RepID=UPI0021A37F43|nr:hypothetical protein [Jannaschia sp. W003]UWQ20010.1 hypothetical protein K3554_08270 [Jannaschia sp. W003]